MKIVIDIPDRLIKKVKDHYVNPYEVDEICEAILDGTPLPEYHGRLIDADALNRRDVNCANVPMNFIDTAPTIVEADRGENENDER